MDRKLLREIGTEGDDDGGGDGKQNGKMNAETKMISDGGKGSPFFGRNDWSQV